MKNKKLKIIGYSGHSFVCLEGAKSMGLDTSGYYETEEKLSNPYKLKYLGNEDNIEIDDQLFVSIGDNRIREKIFKKIIKNNSLDLIIIHEKSIISNSVVIQKQTFINAGAIINSQVIIGKGCIVNTGAIIDHECEIGDFSQTPAVRVTRFTMKQKFHVWKCPELQYTTSENFRLPKAALVPQPDVRHAPTALYIPTVACKDSMGTFWIQILG